jgi:hypothetical protein
MSLLHAQRDIIKNKMLLQENYALNPSALKTRLARESTLRYMSAKYLSECIFKMIEEGDEGAEMTQRLSGSSVKIRIQDVQCFKVHLPTLGRWNWPTG